MLIRHEEPADFLAVHKVIDQAFGQPAEAGLVAQLRAEGDSVIAAVAVENGVVIGHVMFSKMTAPLRTLSLGPVAVAPEWQRQGVGSKLIRWGLEKAAQAEWGAIFVLGDPTFYRRFNFDPSLAKGFVSRYAGPHLMVLGLTQGLIVQKGRIDYAPAFDALG